MNFIHQDNIDMLWEVVSDQELFRCLSPGVQTQVYSMFIHNLKGFYAAEKEKPHTLVDLNKKYIMLILNHLKTQFPIRKIRLEPVSQRDENSIKEVYTHNEPHTTQDETKSHRVSLQTQQFNEDLMRRQAEFEDAMVLKPPPPPAFTDKLDDGPLLELDAMVKKMQAERNYDRLASNPDTTEKEKDEKDEKVEKVEKKEKTDKQKKVSWSATNETKVFDPEIVDLDREPHGMLFDDFFSKLKRQPSERKETIQPHSPFHQIMQDLASIHQKLDLLLGRTVQK